MAEHVVQTCNVSGAIHFGDTIITADVTLYEHVADDHTFWYGQMALLPPSGSGFRFQNCSFSPTTPMFNFAERFLLRLGNRCGQAIVPPEFAISAFGAMFMGQVVRVPFVGVSELTTNVAIPHTYSMAHHHENQSELSEYRFPFADEMPNSMELPAQALFQQLRGLSSDQVKQTFANVVAIMQEPGML